MSLETRLSTLVASIAADIKSLFSTKQNNLGYTPYDASNPQGYTANSSDMALLHRANHTGTQSADTIISGDFNKLFLTEDKDKLDAVPENLVNLLIPSGGLIGQVFSKTSNANYDVGWVTPESGGGGVIINSVQPSSPTEGVSWTDSNSGITYTWFDNGGNGTWAEFGPIGAAGPVGPSGDTGVQGAQGETGVPNGINKSIQFKNDSVLDGSTKTFIDNGNIIVSNETDLTFPTGDFAKLFGKKLASRMFLSIVGPLGMDTPVQPAVWRQKIARWSPIGNSNAVPISNGFVAFTIQGTATARNVATTNLFTRTKRLGYVGAATAGQLAGHYLAVAQYTTGDGSGLGGFFYSCRFGFSDAAAISTARAFIGLSSNIAAATNVDPSTLNNNFGVAQLGTDSSQLFIVYGGSSAQLPIALGTDFPPMNGVGVNNGILYDITFFCSPNSNGVIGYRLERVGTSIFVEGVITPTTAGVQTPLSTTLLAPRAWRCNNTIASAPGIDIINVYMETDF